MVMWSHIMPFKSRKTTAEISFPFEKFIEEQQKCVTNKFKLYRDSETKPLHLHLYLNGGVKFFYKNVIL